MRLHMKRAKEQAEKERAEALRRAMVGQESDSFDDATNDTTDEEQPPDRKSKVASLRSRLRLVERTKRTKRHSLVLLKRPNRLVNNEGNAFYKIVVTPKMSTLKWTGQ
jgi:hypothetical protein